MNNKTPQQRIDGISTDELIRRGEQAVIDFVMVPNELLPENYRGKKPHRKLRSVVNQSIRTRKNNWCDGRDVSVKFDSKQNVTKARQERLDIINQYRDSVDEINETEIEYDVNEDKLYSQSLLWVTAMVSGGYIDAQDLADELLEEQNNACSRD